MYNKNSFDSSTGYVNLGWHILPLHSATENGCSCNKEKCSSVGKHPITPNGV
jgi:hypothetical protein